MPIVEARTRIKGKHYEISVDLDEALKVKNAQGDITIALQSHQIFYDLKKGTVASQSDLQSAFGTSDVYEVARKIISSGEVQKTQEFRDDERERKVRQVVSLIVKNATDQHGRPYTEDRIRSLIAEVHVNFDNRPPDQQMQEVIHKLKEKIPIKVEVKRIKLTIPAQFTGQVYGQLQDYKESEEWLGNGDLVVVLAIPAGMAIDFFEKINSLTHGSVQSEDMVNE